MPLLPQYRNAVKTHRPSFESVGINPSLPRLFPATPARAPLTPTSLSPETAAEKAAATHGATLGTVTFIEGWLHNLTHHILLTVQLPSVKGAWMEQSISARASEQRGAGTGAHGAGEGDGSGGERGDVPDPGGFPAQELPSPPCQRGSLLLSPQRCGCPRHSRAPAPS